MARSAYSRQVATEQEMRRRYVRARDQRKTEDVGRATEARYRSLQEEASKHRRRAAMAVDAVAREHGDVLGWKAMVGDPDTTPDCLAAHGKNFRVSNPPAIGYPGAAHQNCRCEAVAPWPGAPLLGSGVQTTPDGMSDFIRRAVASARRNVQRFFGRENG